jgi:poly-beta-1,6-N-acetyl-D-glucosamine synthase
VATFYWLGVAILVYTYIGYGVLLAMLIFWRRWWQSRRPLSVPVAGTAFEAEPAVALIVAAYNESAVICEKAENSLALDYPPARLKLLFVTDGSDDGTDELLRPFTRIELLHQPERIGKIASVNRALAGLTAPILIFSDANTLLNQDAIRAIVRHYQNADVGAVAGEKRVRSRDRDTANATGEGLYWRYESFLKRLDSELYSVVGAAGELFSVRRDLYEPVESDTILDDFVISLRIAAQGYRVVYEPGAYALELPSASLAEEFERKGRNCAGGFQAMVRLSSLLNPFRHGLLTFQYVSHRVLRWSLAPLALLLILPLNLYLAWQQGALYTWLLGGQLLFYLMALLGWYLENKQLRLKLLFVPFYFTLMNAAVYAGFYRFITGRQSVLWEKARRQNL